MAFCVFHSCSLQIRLCSTVKVAGTSHKLLSVLMLSGLTNLRFRHLLVYTNNKSTKVLLSYYPHSTIIVLLWFRNPFHKDKERDRLKDILTSNVVLFHFILDPFLFCFESSMQPLFINEVVSLCSFSSRCSFVFDKNCILNTFSMFSNSSNIKYHANSEVFQAFKWSFTLCTLN